MLFYNIDVYEGYVVFVRMDHYKISIVKEL